MHQLTNEEARGHLNAVLHFYQTELAQYDAQIPEFVEQLRDWVNTMANHVSNQNHQPRTMIDSKEIDQLRALASMIYDVCYGSAQDVVERWQMRSFREAWDVISKTALEIRTYQEQAKHDRNR